MIEKECPKCKSKNLSDGVSDFLYDAFRGIEVPIQFCHDCSNEWFVKITEEEENEK